jgi:transposase
MIDRTQLQDMGADELRALALELMTEVQAQQHIVDRTEAALRFSDAKLAQLTHEMAILKRWKFAARSEKLGHEQQSLLDEAIDADLAAIELELETLSTEPKTKDAPGAASGEPSTCQCPSRSRVDRLRLWL